MGKYCCFFDPMQDYQEKELTDCCPKCGRPYDYILKNIPSVICNGGTQYQVIRSIGRGFYGATYLCNVKKRFRTENILLKIIPVDVYSFFHKDFYAECQRHAELSEKTEHLVKISDAFDANVKFDECEITCHIAELQYVHGDILSDYLEKTDVGPKAFAQIAIDLLKMWSELIQKGEYHNDLHMGNLMVEYLDDSIQRVDAIYDKIRLIAIDMNSATNQSLSNYDTDRHGDRKYISDHIEFLSKKLRNKYSSLYNISDSDYRLIETLNKVSKIISVESTASDFPEISELIDMIKDSFKSNLSFSPWKKEFSLSKINDGINAQTIPSCFVPQLLVDPDNSWIAQISILGPQLITGMRGCGKTMLLYSVDVHARLRKEGNDESQTLKYSIDNDAFVGISASCRDLLELDDISNDGLSKLLLIYSIQIIRAVRHMQDINYAEIEKNYYMQIARSIEQIFDLTFEKDVLYSDISLERRLSEFSNNMRSFCKSHKMIMSRIASFELLADTFLSTTNKLSNKQVFFLLDDASTRYLSPDDISKLLTNVVFMSERCAFKITTEMQTLYSFMSPGSIEKAQDIRDYQVFDLGADVFQKTRDPKTGKQFIEEIIAKRLKACNGMSFIPNSLEKALGDCSLLSIAKSILNNTSSKSRKSVYYGATALTALCVGDIGDIIFLYESILSNNTSNHFPVDRKTQTKSFQQLCSRRMYNLERKDGTLREYVKAFSEASYKCLIDSRKAITKDGDSSNRTRQYNSLYVRMTTGNIAEQQIALRKLVDAGIFVYADGNGWPRSKSNDTDPITQVKLAFRKLFGVSNFIPLGNSDRFELSGESLEQWLSAPSKELLLRNLGGNNDSSENNETYLDPYGNDEAEPLLEDLVGDDRQLSLLDVISEMSAYDNSSKGTPKWHSEIYKRATILDNKEISSEKSFDVGIFGLGFEERTLESVKRITSSCTFSRVILVQYGEAGKTADIRRCFSKEQAIDLIPFEDIDALVKQLELAKTTLIDITGLYKPIIFDVIRHVLISNKEITVVYTAAKEYYPLNSDIKPLLENGPLDDTSKFINLMHKLTTGETNDYTNMPIIQDNTRDAVRPTVLVGFVSPKNQRIFSLLDKTEYEAISLFVPEGKTERDTLSRTAGNIAATNYSSVELKKFNTSDPNQVLYELSKVYERYYIDNDFNFELALTGSKMQAVAAAIFSSICRVSQCWYVKPCRFDTAHFTKGVGNTSCYKVSIEK